MKKSNLIIGLIYVAVGIACLMFTLLFETKLTTLLSGLTGAGIGGGAMILWKYYYWTRPENKSRYEEKLENENIELHDERKEKLRDRSGRYAYILGLILLSISIVVFAALGELEIIEDTRWMVIYLFGLLVFQYVIGIVIYRRLSKKY